MSARKTGTVKWFDQKKGIGFITPDDGTEEIFVHHTAIEMKGYRLLNNGDEVEFGTVAGRPGKGPKADRVKVLRAANPHSG
jgi:CspA family cold shock protein